MRALIHRLATRLAMRTRPACPCCADTTKECAVVLVCQECGDNISVA